MEIVVNNMERIIGLSRDERLAVYGPYGLRRSFSVSFMIGVVIGVSW